VLEQRYVAVPPHRDGHRASVKLPTCHAHDSTASGFLANDCPFYPEEERMLRTHDTSKAGGSVSLDWPSIAVASSKLRRPPPTAIERARVENAALLRLGTIFVAGEVVVVSGSVSREAAATAALEINGHRVAIGSSGSFCATVRLEGEPALTLSLETETRETITMQIPVRASALRPRVGAPPQKETGEPRPPAAADS